MKKVVLFTICFLLYAMNVYTQVAESALECKTESAGGYISIPDHETLDLTGHLTLEMWVKFDVTQANQQSSPYFFNKENWGDNSGFLFFINADESNKICFRVNGTSGYSQRLLWSLTTYFDDLEWHHIAIVHSNSGYTILVVDGIERKSINMINNGTIATNSNDLIIGTDFRGRIDEVRIWNQYYTAEQIRNRMFLKITEPENYSNLKAYFRLDENTGTTVNDATTNNNDGAFVDSPTWIPSLAVLAHKEHCEYHYLTTQQAPNFTENDDVPVDINWGNNPGESIVAALQINQAPTVITNLPTNYASTFWELWLRENQYSWTCNVNFHYDNIGGINNENNLKLYTRSQPGDSWTEVSGYTIVTNDGGSSTTTDGVGYITANGLSSFSQFIIGSDTESLPITLSIFTSQFIENTPTLYWVTQSETDNIGWNVYRNTEEEFSSSQKITNEMIQGNGTTTEPSYYIYNDTSENIIIGQTYWYWLESIDLGGETHYYNQAVNITIPDITQDPTYLEPPVVYGLKSLPNPTKSSVHITFTLNKPALAEISIYNILGELVKTLPMIVTTEDYESKVYWNGKDENENVVKDGIYFFQLNVDGKPYQANKLILLR